MKRTLLLVMILFLLSPSAGAIIEEDWGNYTRADKSDDSGNNVTLSWLRKSYTNDIENYTVTLKDFDPTGNVVLDVIFKGQYERVILSGKWDENRTKMILTAKMELFNKTILITPLRIVPPEGIFVCCPEAEININVLRPKLKIEISEDSRSIYSDFTVVNPYANWSGESWKIDPFDNSFETKNVSISLRPDDSYRMYEEIPVEINITNEGDAETSNTAVYIDIDGLRFETGKPFYQLSNLIGTKQQNLPGETSQTIKMKLRFPFPPTKLNYTIHAYVKAVKGDTIYYNDASKTVYFLPSIAIRKSVTQESMLLSRKDVESIYTALDSDSISRWLSGGEIFVSLGVTNHQNYEIKGMKLNDALNRQLIAENISLNWTFNLKPYESKEFKYTLKAMRPGKFNLPSAHLSYSEFNMSWDLLSTAPSTEVHGPCMQVFKKPDKPVLTKGENTTVTLTIRNTGDMPSLVKVIDSLAENVTFLGGRMYYEGKLLPKESTEISYNISLNEYGQMDLPNPRVYVNGKDDPGCGEPLISKILVKEPSEPTSQKTIKIPETPASGEIPALPSKQYGWLEGVLPVFMFVLAVAVLFILHRSSK